jgi:voltage-gated sodium channel
LANYPSMAGLYSFARRVVETRWFDPLVACVILLNAAALGFETYDVSGSHDAIAALDAVFITFFLCELALRIASYGPRPLRFFREGWNIFDFVVITAVFIPGIGKSTTLLRLLRLARVARLVRIFPDMRLLVKAVGRSLPKVASLMLLTILTLYVYAVVGWLIFEDRYPEQWGNLGESMLTLFVMTTLENFPDRLAEGRAVSDWTILYFVSFAVVAVFILFNLLIGIVISSLDEARTMAAEEELAARVGHEPTIDDREQLVQDRLTALKSALSALEREIAGRSEPRGP